MTSVSYVHLLGISRFGAFHEEHINLEQEVYGTIIVFKKFVSQMTKIKK